MMKYKKSTIYRTINIKVFSEKYFYYLSEFTNYVLNTTNNKKNFALLNNLFEENFKIKIQEGSLLKYLKIHIAQSALGFSIDQTGHIIYLVN